MNTFSTTNPELLELLARYFSLRGPFLARAIRADLQHFRHTHPVPGGFSHNGNGKQKKHYLGAAKDNGNGIAPQSSASTPHDNGSDTPSISLPSSGQSSHERDVTASTPTLDVEAILLDLVVQQTGFPRDSVGLHLRLLDDLNLDSIKGGELVAGLATACGVAGRVDASTLANASLAEIAESVREVLAPVESPPPQAAPTPAQAPAIADLLLASAVQQTGFARESLSLSMRLLDDLNLDSIKSAELVSAVAKQVGVAGQIDPANFANATLAEIAEAIETLVGEASPTPSSAAPSPAPAPLNTEVKELPWVRDFVVEFLPEDMPPLPVSAQENWETANLFAVDDWQGAQVLLVSEPAEAEIAATLAQAWQFQGASTRTVTFAELAAEELIQRPEFTHIVAIMPRQPQGEMSPEARLQRAMQRVRAIATPPPAAKAQRQYTTVAYLQFGGGYFGKVGDFGDIEQSCTIGFGASLHLERADLKVRTIDLPPAIAPERWTGLVLAELARPEAYGAVGYDAELVRRVPRPQVQEPARYQPRSLVWNSQDVLLVTGGAKGITAECILAFARQTGVRTALVGSSPHPSAAPNGKSSAEIATTLERFRSAGLTCRYYQCDMGDGQAVAALVAQVRAELGAVTGVIHGAALNKPRRVENSTLEAAQAEVAPKVSGAMHLCAALAEAPPKLLVGFSSISAVLGLPGNTWYGFSNEALDLLLRRFGQAHPETAVLAIAFSVWSQVGMGARMGTVRNLERMGIEAMPTEDGVEHFLRLMTNDPGDTQVVVSARLGGIDTLRRGFDTWRTRRVPPATTAKFLERIQIMEPGVEIVARTQLSCERDSYVQDHIYRGSYLFPTVFGLEAMAQAVAYATGQDQLPPGLCIQDLRLERPIVVDPQQGVEIEIRAQVQERATPDAPLQVRSEIRTERTGFAIAHFAATFVLQTLDSAPTVTVEHPATPLDLDPQQDLYGGLLFQGQRFQRLKQVYLLNSQRFVFNTRRGLSDNDVQARDRAQGPFLLGDPYYRDSLLQSVQPVVPQDICLPVRVENWQICQLPPAHEEETCLGVVDLHGRQDRQYHSTVFAVASNGQLLERLDGYYLQILEHQDQNPTAEELADPGQRDEQRLRDELNARASALDLAVPEVSLAYLSGLHSLPVAERHQQELPVFSRAIRNLLDVR